MESLPLKELDFGLQKRTVPSSGVVASIVLVSPGLECPGGHISCVQNRLFISSECPFHTLGADWIIFKYTSLYIFFYGYKGQ